MPTVEKARVLRHQQVAPDLYEMDLMAPGIAQEGRPGQFLNIRGGDSYDPLLRRPLSIYDLDPAENMVSLLYRVIGKGTRLYSEIQVGECLDLMGPLGRGFSLKKGGSRALLVGGGVGIAPLIYLARELRGSGWQVQLLQGVESEQYLVAEDRLRSMGVEVFPATMDGSRGYQGLVTGLLEEQFRPEKIDALYTCGPEAMMARVAQYANDHHIWGEASLESHMACGVGACLGCARKLRSGDEVYAKICTDGPVFNMEELDFIGGGCK